MRKVKKQFKVKTSIKAGVTASECANQCVAQGGDPARCVERCCTLLGGC